MSEPDWSTPWLAPYRQRGQVLLQHWRAGASVAEALNRGLPQERPRLAAGPLCFVAQHELPPGEAYEAFIARSACVPTRDNWHDFFNGLVWLHRPGLKRRLNAWHGEGLAQAAAGRRGVLRDALTLLDENGALLQAPAALAAALAARDWQRLFVDLRPLWRQARLEIVGHALLEKLLQPRKPICAHVLLVDAIETADLSLSAEHLAAKPFHPLPVLGVPQWWAANEDADFYADAAVFRPPAQAANQLASPLQPKESSCTRS